MQHIVDTAADKRASKNDIKVLLNMLYEYAMRNDYVQKDYAKYIVLPTADKASAMLSQARK